MKFFLNKNFKTKNHLIKTIQQITATIIKRINIKVTRMQIHFSLKSFEYSLKSSVLISNRF